MTSMAFFPFEFTFLPGLNTKNLLAALGLVIFVMSLVRVRKAEVPWPFLVLLIISSVVGLVGKFSLLYNGTNDDAYSNYLITAVIWLSSAYAVCKTIKALHGKLTLPHLIKYLVAVSVFQCVMALLIDNFMAVRLFVDRYVAQGQSVLQDMDRLYGIGAYLDVAGSRFAAVLIMLAFLMRREKEKRGNPAMALMVISYVVISVVGSMIARTTYVGIILSLGVIVLNRDFWSPIKSLGTVKLFALSVGLIIILVGLAIFLYNTNARFHENLRFAFEGFFNLFETGEYQVDSNSKLMTMYVWPDNFKTWIIGDGYFNNPRGDINYVGNSTTLGYYMGTDVGYCRFIFYFGIIGLIAISGVMVYAALSSAKRLPRYSVMILLILLANFVVWLKVSTDLFPALSLIFCVAMLVGENEEEEENEVLEE